MEGVAQGTDRAPGICWPGLCQKGCAQPLAHGAWDLSSWSVGIPACACVLELSQGAPGQQTGLHRLLSCYPKLSFLHVIRPVQPSGSVLQIGLWAWACAK